MKTLNYLMLSILPFVAAASCIDISPEPIAVAYAPNSILDNPPPEFMDYVGDKSYWGSRTSVVWCAEDTHIVSTSMLDHSLQVFQFDATECSLVPKSYHKSNLRLHRPESITISPDGQFAAIANYGNGLVHLYEIGPKTFVDCGLPNPVQCIKINDPHGATLFSKDFLGVTTMDSPTRTVFYRISKKSTGLGYSCECVCQIVDAFLPRQPKSVVWSEDHRFVVICHAIKNQDAPYVNMPGVVASYRLHEESGIVDPIPISQISSSGMECLVFCRHASCLIGSDLYNSRIVAIPFNEETGELGEEQTVLQGAKSQLSFLHGLALSSDERYLCVGNFGDDKVAIYAINKAP